MRPVWQEGSLWRRFQRLPAVVAHRGASVQAPENTFPAFALAVESGADCIELDVQLTQDRELVVIHDWLLERTTNGRGPVGQATLTEIKKLDAGSWFGGPFTGLRVPTLAEVLEWARGKIPLAIELKSTPVRVAGLADLVVAAIRAQHMIDEVLLLSFDHQAVLQAKEIAPEIATGVLFACRPIRPLDLATDASARAIAPHWTFVNPELVSECHQAGIALFTWLVNRPEEMEYLLACGVDAIATDNPGLLREVRDTRGLA